MRRNIIPKKPTITEFYVNWLPDLKIHPIHKDVLLSIDSSLDKISYINGSTGTGKTTVAMLATFYYALKKKNSKIAMVHEHQEIAYHTSRRFGQLFEKHVCLISRREILLHNGSTIKLSTDPRDLRGVDWDLVTLDYHTHYRDREEEFLATAYRRASKIIKTQNIRNHPYENYFKIGFH